MIAAMRLVPIENSIELHKSKRLHTKTLMRTHFIEFINYYSLSHSFRWIVHINAHASLDNGIHKILSCCVEYNLVFFFSSIFVASLCMVVCLLMGLA